MKKLLVSILCMTTLLAGLAVGALVAPAAQAQGSTSSTGMHTPNWTTGGAIPHPTVSQFNPSSGQLVSATVTVSATIETTFDRMSNESGLAGSMEGRTNTNFCAALSATSCAGSGLFSAAASASAQLVELRPSTVETFANMQVAETRVGSSPAADSSSGSFTVTGADLSSFIGNGTVPIFCKADALTGATGPGTAGADWHTLAGCAVSVAYSFAGIDIEKTTNGVQADTAAESVNLDEGAPITWAYVVSNPGNVAIVNAQVTDNMLGHVCVIDRLEPGASQSCLMTGIAEPGMHRMEATVVGNPVGQPGVELTDSDPTGYVVDDDSGFAVVPATDPAVDPQIDIELATNTADADSPSGPTVTNGGPIEWTYVVTNTGATELVDVIVVDGDGQHICTIGLLGLRQASECKVPSQATCADSGRRDSKVTGVSPEGVRVSDADPTHWSTVGCNETVAVTETTPVANPVTPKPETPAEPAAEQPQARPTGATRTDLPTSLAYTGSESNGPAAVALVVSALGLIAFSGSEALKRRHAEGEEVAQQG